MIRALSHIKKNTNYLVNFIDLRRCERLNNLNKDFELNWKIKNDKNFYNLYNSRQFYVCDASRWFERTLK